MTKKILVVIFIISLITLSAGCAKKRKLLVDDADSFSLRARYAMEDTQTLTEEFGPWKGWDYLAQKLMASGIPEEEVKSVFLDKRLPVFSFVPFKLKPRESSQMYSQFTTPARLKIAANFIETNREHFEEAENLFHVSRYVVAAIIMIETGCGQNTGKESIFYRLARVSSVGDKENLDLNFSELKKSSPSVSFSQVKERADYLEATFYPEILALFRMKEQGIDILDVHGSLAGAFGLPQFLPSAYVNFAVDGDKDGKTSLFSQADAIWSAAHFLSAHGWQNDASVKEKMSVLWEYNRSDAYGQAVLKVAVLLKNMTIKGNKK